MGQLGDARGVTGDATLEEAAGPAVRAGGISCATICPHPTPLVPLSAFATTGDCWSEGLLAVSGRDREEAEAYADDVCGRGRSGAVFGCARPILRLLDRRRQELVLSQRRSTQKK